MRCLFIYVLLGMLAAAGQAQTPAPIPPSAFRISGTVVNVLTGQPLPSVDIAIGPAEKPGSWQMVTAEDGRFHFENLASGKYWLEAQGRGFSPQRFDQHEEFSTAIAVGPNFNAEALIFRVRPDAAITGIVTDDQNEPVRDANVLLFRTGTLNGAVATHLINQASTNDQGHYRFGHVNAGTFFVAVSARPWYANAQRLSVGFERGPLPGRMQELSDASVESSDAGLRQPELDVTYPLTFYSGAPDPAGATPLAVKPGQRVAADIILTPVPALSLRISDPGIDPSKSNGVGLTQRLFGGNALSVPAEVTSVKKGEIEIGGVSPGEFLLDLHIWGKNPGQNPATREKQIEVSGNSYVDMGGVSAAPTIRGVVHLDTTKPSPQKAVILFSPRLSGGGLLAQVSADGKFEIENVHMRPGRYEVSVFSTSGTFVKSLTATGASVLGREVDIPDGASVHLDITLSQGAARVNGTALRDGKPFAGAMVVLVPEDIYRNSPLVRRDQSDSDGTFSLYNVSPGRYTVIAIENGWDLQWMTGDVLAPYLKKGETVEVVPRGKYDVKTNVR